MNDIETARARHKTVTDFESNWVNQARDEIRFEAGDQWDDRIKSARETDPQGPRPCLVMNHARKHVNNLTNEFRSTRPTFKVLPADSHADPETAEMMNGMLRHIQVSGEASIAYDNAARMQRIIGLGFFRIGTQITSPVTREQDITVSPIRSSFSVKVDPHAKHMAARDARWMFVEEDMSKDRFKELYPKADLKGFEGSRDSGLMQWITENTIRVAEYWTLTTKATEIIETPLGFFRAEDLEARAESLIPVLQGEPIREHTIDMPYVMCRKMNGAEFLEEKEFPADYIPIVRVIGEERWVENERDYRGIIRDMMDPQRVLNYEASTNVERMSLEALAPWVGPDEAFEGHEAAWGGANTERRAYLPYNQYNERQEALNPPTRNLPLPPNAASITAQQMAANNIQDLSGMPQASFGAESNEKSGRALMAKQHQSDQNTFHFNDNMATSMTHAGRIILSMIPRVYDTDRIVRILGEDEKPDWAHIAPTGRPFVESRDAAGGIERLYDLSVGTYDMVVSTGPSHLTRRTEAAEGAVQLVSNNPQLWAIMGDWLVRMLDWPGAEEIADRIKLMLPPEIKQMEAAKKDGKDEATMELQAIQQAMMAQVQPIITELEQALQAATMEADEKEAKLQKLGSQLEDKRAEYELKLAEIRQRDADSMRDHEAAMAGHKKDLVIASMKEEPDAPPAPEEPKSEQSTVVESLVAAEMGRVLSGQMNALAEQMSAMATKVDSVEAQGEEIKATQAEGEKRREAVKLNVVKFLKDNDEAALTRAANEA